MERRVQNWADSRTGKDVWQRGQPQQPRPRDDWWKSSGPEAPTPEKGRDAYWKNEPTPEGRDERQGEKPRDRDQGKDRERDRERDCHKAEADSYRCACEHGPM